MNNRLQRNTAWILALWAFASIAVGAVAQTAVREETPASANAETMDKSNNTEEIYVLEDFVVTGTQVRGTTPVGTNLKIMVDTSLPALAAVSANQVLASVPQVSNYFNNPQSSTVTSAGAQTQQVMRPNLRNLPGGLGSGGSTLVLIDGHRVAGAGVTTFATDPDIVPMGALENVEISTDGGSAVYGADAIGGVINFIPRHRYDGLRVNVRYGAADHYYKTDFNVTAGKDWGKGSIFVSVNYSKSSDILGRDLEYVQRKDWATGIPTGRQTSVPNVTVNNVNYALPGMAANTFNSEDVLAYTSQVPEITRKGVYAGFEKKLSKTIKLNVSAFNSERDTRSNLGPATLQVTIPTSGAAANYWMAQPQGQQYIVAGAASEQFSLSLAPALGYYSLLQSTHIGVWGVAANLTVDISDQWQLRTLLNYSQSKSDYFSDSTNGTALAAAANGTTAATALNPYNVAATAPGVLTAILNDELAGRAQDRLANARAILDGTLFKLPGGKLKVAIGAEYAKDDFKQVTMEGPKGAIYAMPFATYNRHVEAGFVELNIPIVGASNSMTGVKGMTLSIASRHDRYSDFGTTTNQKFGLDYKPVKWISLHGNIGTSFNAPTPVDQLGAKYNTLTLYPFSILPSFAFKPMLVLSGSTANLKPQTAQTYMFGTDIEPPAIPGLTLSCNYYHIMFKGILNKAPVFNAQQMTSFYPEYFTVNPTTAQIQNYINSASNGAAIASQIAAGGLTINELIDFRVSNLGNTSLSGIDFGAKYHRVVGKVGYDVGITGNYKLVQETQLSGIAPFTNDLQTGVPKMTMQTTLGMDIKKFRAQATWNYTRGYAVQASASLLQDRVASYGTVDLFFGYALKGSNVFTKNLSLTLNVSNILDKNPPILRNSAGNGYANGFSLGRVVMLGVDKKF